MNAIARRFQPHINVDQITGIDLGQLRRLDIRGILIDLEGTLTYLNGCGILPQYRDWVKKISLEFPTRVITCNHERKNLGLIAESIGHEPLQKKPWERTGTFFRRAASSINCNPSQVAIINDSFIMLGLFAKPLGCLTIKVSSIDFQQEHSPIGYVYRFGRWVEDQFILPYLIRS